MNKEEGNVYLNSIFSWNAYFLHSEDGEGEFYTPVQPEEPHVSFWKAGIDGCWCVRCGSLWLAFVWKGEQQHIWDNRDNLSGTKITSRFSFFLNSCKLKKPYLKLPVVSDHALSSGFCRCSPPFIVSFALSSLSTTPQPLISHICLTLKLTLANLFWLYCGYFGYGLVFTPSVYRVFLKADKMKE